MALSESVLRCCPQIRPIRRHTGHFLESDIFGPATVGQILKGKSYNRAVRAHKTLMEALSRLCWQALGYLEKERCFGAGLRWRWNNTSYQWLCHYIGWGPKWESENGSWPTFAWNYSFARSSRPILQGRKPGLFPQSGSCPKRFIHHSSSSTSSLRFLTRG